jgi:major membrane immunogen (membrane-anchored lipoprotein)
MLLCYYIEKSEGACMKQDNIIATQGLTNLFAGQPDMDSTDKKIEFIKTKLREFFNLKNVNFLFGAGTSNGAIDTMRKLYKHLEFSKDEENEEKEFKSIVAKEGENLEKILKVMYSARNYYNGIQEEDAKDEAVINSFKELYDRLITKVEKHILIVLMLTLRLRNVKKFLDIILLFIRS